MNFEESTNISQVESNQIKICPRCKKNNNPLAKFCIECGNNIKNCSRTTMISISNEEEFDLYEYFFK